MQYFLGNDYYLLTLLSCVFFVILNVVFVFFELKKAIKANFYKYFDFVYLFFAIAFVFVSRLYTFGCEVTNIDESFHIAIALDFSSIEATNSQSVSVPLYFNPKTSERMVL